MPTRRGRESYSVAGRPVTTTGRRGSLGCRSPRMPGPRSRVSAVGVREAGICLRRRQPHDRCGRRHSDRRVLGRLPRKADNGGRGDVTRRQRQHAGDGAVAVPAAGDASGPGGSRQGQEDQGVKVYYSVSGRHLRNTILRFEHLRRFEPYCLFFGATERELATRARAEGRGKIVNFVPNFFFELDRSFPSIAQWTPSSPPCRRWTTTATSARDQR